MATKIKSFEQFQKFVIDLVRLIVEKGDANGASDKATIEKLSADLTTANQKNQELVAALEAKNAELASAIAAEQGKALEALDTLSTELANTFNAQSTADAVAQAVVETPAIATPAVVEAATEIGTAEPTPPAVLETSLEAIDSVGSEVAAVI